MVLDFHRPQPAHINGKHLILLKAEIVLNMVSPGFAHISLLALHMQLLNKY